MSRIKMLLVFCSIVIILVACAPSPAAIQTAIAQTQGMEATILYETRSAPTATRTPTSTRPPTSTSTPTYTAEPPMTQTAQYKISVATNKAAFATHTAESRSATKTALAAYKYINTTELIQYPFSYDGQKVFFGAVIKHNMGGGYWEILADGQYEPSYAHILYGPTKVGQHVTIYGVVGNHDGTTWTDATFKPGQMCGETSTGSTNYCWTFISSAFVTR